MSRRRVRSQMRCGMRASPSRCEALRACRDPLRLRAAELFFREQTVALEDGRVMLADEEIVDMQAASGLTGIAQLLAEAGTPQRAVTLDVLGEDNAGLYWPKTSFLKHPGTITMRIGPAIPTAGRDPAEVIAETERWIEQQQSEICPARSS